jgi:hypothetical protein
MFKYGIKKAPNSPSLTSARLVVEKQALNPGPGPRLAMPESPSSPPALRPNTLLQAGSGRAAANWLRVGSAALKTTRQMSLSPMDQRPVPMIGKISILNK